MLKMVSYNQCVVSNMDEIFKSQYKVAAGTCKTIAAAYIQINVSFICRIDK